MLPKWNHDQILLLIHSRYAAQNLPNNGRNNIYRWDNVMDIIKQKDPNFPYTKKEAFGKFGKLLLTYKRIKRRLETNENSTYQWLYFDVFDKAFKNANLYENGSANQNFNEQQTSLAIIDIKSLSQNENTNDNLSEYIISRQPCVIKNDEIFLSEEEATLEDNSINTNSTTDVLNSSELIATNVNSFSLFQTNDFVQKDKSMELHEKTNNFNVEKENKETVVAKTSISTLFETNKRTQKIKRTDYNEKTDVQKTKLKAAFYSTETANYEGKSNTIYNTNEHKNICECDSCTCDAEMNSLNSFCNYIQDEIENLDEILQIKTKKQILSFIFELKAKQLNQN